MICMPCKTGGTYLRYVNTGADLDEVQGWHENCTAPATCPCQHSVKSLTKQGTEV